MTDNYVELHTHTEFSPLGGTSSPEDLVLRAAELGMSALGLTDDNRISGIPAFVHECHKAGIKPVVGAELTLHDQSHLTLFVQNEQGSKNLNALISAAQHNAPKGKAMLPEGGLKGYTDGLIALSGSQLGRVPSAVLRGDYKAALRDSKDFIRLFGKDHFWIELQHHLHPKDSRLIADLADLATQIGVGVVATNDVRYASQNQHDLFNVLQCIQNKTTFDEATQLHSNSEYYLKSGADLAHLFRAYPHALHNTRVIADQCNFEPIHGLQDLPKFPTPDGLSADAYLRQLCITEAGHRQLPTKGYEQIDYELSVIIECGLSNYFLIVWDVVRFARENGIRCQGRGSAAGSLVAYLLGISPINPLVHNLVFERFLSSGRKVDIDIDFDGLRRDEVLQYLYERWGRDHVAMACTFVTFHARSAIRDIGKVLGLPNDLLGHITSSLDTYHAGSLRESASLREAIGSRIGTETWQHILDLSEQIEGIPRHLGVHNGGMVITGSLITDRVPTEPATKEKTTVTQWDKDGLADAGMIKIDILGLMTLTVVTDALKVIEQMTGNMPDIDALSCDDASVYDMICAGDSVGVFQIESRAQAQILPRIKPRTLDMLMMCVSMIRPGPIEAGTARKLVEITEGRLPETYAHPLLVDPLKETRSVLLYQEQCLQIAHNFAGFTHAQGELLRRAFGAKNAHKEIERLHQAFIEGALAKGVTLDIAESVFNSLRAFGSYSFAKSHAASFATLVYKVAWLKRYYPLAFYVALLNNQPMGFWSPAVLVNDAKRHHIPIYTVDMNISEYRCTVKSDGIQLGFNYVQELNEDDANTIIKARKHKPFASLDDFCRRVQLPRHLNENLIRAGAMDKWGKSRRDLLWMLGLQDEPGSFKVYAQDEPIDFLPALTTAEKTGMEYAVTRVSTGAHPMSLYRARLNKRGTMTSKRLNQHPAGRIVWVAGLMVVHQSPPTAKGFHFITLEDEYGFINLIVSPKVYLRFRRVIHNSALLIAKGKVQHQSEVTNLIVERCAALREETF